jgi:hypothetical protein
MRALCVSVAIAGALLAPAHVAAGPHHMTETQRSVDVGLVTPEPGKAALVVARTTGWGRLITFDTYLEREMIGATRGKGYFIKTDVTPGAHYVISKAENWETVKIVFEPGRVYYILEVVRMGMLKARLSKQLLTPAELKQTIDDGCKLLVYDGTGPNLEDKDYEGAVADYEREVKEGAHNEHASYRGVPAADIQADVSAAATPGAALPPPAAPEVSAAPPSKPAEPAPAVAIPPAPVPTPAAPTPAVLPAAAATSSPKKTEGVPAGSPAGAPASIEAPASGADEALLQPGMTFQQVEEKVGRPAWRAGSGKYARWAYGHFSVLFENGLVVRIVHP